MDKERLLGSDTLKTVDMTLIGKQSRGSLYKSLLNQNINTVMPFLLYTFYLDFVFVVIFRYLFF